MLHRGSAEEKRRRQLPSFLVAKYGLTALFYFTIAWRRTRQSAEEHVCMSWQPSRLVSSRWHGTCYSHTMPPVRWYRGQQWAGCRSRSRSHGQPNLLYDCEVRRLYGRRAARIAVRVGAAEGRPCARAMVTITSSRRGTPWRLDWSLIQLLAD